MEDVRPPLDAGMRLRIRPLADEAEAGYEVGVDDVSDEWILVHRPRAADGPVRLETGAKVELNVTITDHPGKEGQYRGETVVYQVMPGAVPLLRLAWPKEWQRFQHRKYFRVPVALPVKVRPISGGASGGEAPAVVPGWAEGTMRDLSGGGCQVVAPLEVEPEQKVALQFRLPTEAFSLVAEVKSISPSEEDERMHVIGLAFVELHEDLRDEIVRYTFQRQIELRKKGMA